MVTTKEIKRDLKNISVLLVERALSPYGDRPHGYLTPLIDYLGAWCSKFDVVWSLEDHHFVGLEEFIQHAKEIIDSRYASIDSDKGENEKIKRIRKECFFDPSTFYNFLRKKPFNSIEDLKNYDIILAHPGGNDSYILYDFHKKYSNIPVGIVAKKISEITTEIPERQVRGVWGNIFKDLRGIYIIESMNIAPCTITGLVKYHKSKRIKP